ncbi:hypothetical protein [Flavobacterium sp. 25HG05S-40]|uniref:hypothetical protein n=1 Tax=Flavobacterium sp. 25HG05S-40 TaxID=3458682 RepID=UPI004043F0EC
MKPVNEKDAFKIPSDWEVKAKLLRRRFPQLTSSDVTIDQDDGHSMLRRLEKKLDKTRSEVIEIIKNTLPNKFINNLKIQYHE